MAKVTEGKTIFLERKDLLNLLKDGQISLGGDIFLILKGGRFKKAEIKAFGNAYHALVRVEIGKEFKNAFIVPAERKDVEPG